ncbi:lipoprotein [Filimonas lacunae]|nr:lipoprotein [Filimonas lacunae]
MLCFSAQAQKTKPVRYPSLLWEITGNGLEKPSYLFGTMHVSSKMVFHLSDSFYHAIQGCDVVALELNPYFWQRDMMKMEGDQRNLTEYISKTPGNFMLESSFRLMRYEDNLKAALTEDPTLINGLLYRSVQSQADYEESTYLDLYIYQTGRKLGKQPGGVEDYYEAERLQFEAYQDMAKEKNKKRPDTDGESMQNISKKLQEAYRRGDLDMLDSLEKLTSVSAAFNEKFIYKRNEIQANSMDTIMRHRALFVGVGAAHLPGERGVIELLRKKGYRLRPVIMQDRDATRKEAIDKMRVPVAFNQVTTDDGIIAMQLPGPLYKRSDTYVSMNNGSWQYADMDNGAYYMLTRVKTHAAVTGDSKKEVVKKIDSLLYENIPGRIIKKTAIVKNGYPGFDITNRTRRGDLQRYNILVTPFEVLVFKMSGNDDYVDGAEAHTFFSSIQVGNNEKKWQQFTPSYGDFSVLLPQQPVVRKNTGTTDRLARWEYEAEDSTTQTACFIWKKTIANYSFLEEDTFDLSLLEQSLKKSECISRQLKREQHLQNGYPALDMSFELKSGQLLKARAVLRGAHYYLVAATAPKKNEAVVNKYLESFQLTDFTYATPVLYADTSLHFTVKTAVQPTLDTTLVRMMNRALNESFLDDTYNQYSYWPAERFAGFRADSTGEVITVRVQQYPKYFYSKDTVKFWREELNEKQYKDRVVTAKTRLQLPNGTIGYQLEIQDTNTSKKIIRRHLLKDNYTFCISAFINTIRPSSSFVKDFFNSFTPEDSVLGPSVFENKVNKFFADYYSKDTAVRKKASAAISNVYFSIADTGRLQEAIDRLQYGNKNYFDVKNRFINEFGFLKDSCCVDKVVQQLERLYNKTADTSYFQDEVLRALARLKNKISYAKLKELLLQDPPILTNRFDQNALFNHLEDSLELTRSLFPELLQLASLEDYKTPVIRLLRKMADSGQIAAKDYETYYSKIYFDAKIELKRQQGRDEKTLEKQSELDENDGDSYERGINNDLSSSDLANYAVLIAPYYNKNAAVPRYFERLLQSKDPEVQCQAALIMLKNNYKVSDTIWRWLAAKEDYRARLLELLEDIKRKDLFPATYKKQDLVARAVLMHAEGYARLDTIAVLSTQKVRLKEKEGIVYFFKYRVKKGDEWKLGISGLQPVNTKEVSSGDDLVSMTNRKLKTGDELKEQLDTELRKLVYALRPSAAEFFENADIASRYEF